MDRRSLLIVLALSFTLFFVNHYFSSQNQEEHRQRLEEYKAKQTSKLADLQTFAKTNTASYQQLPLATLKDAAQKESSILAVKSGNSFITIAWADSLPSTLKHDQSTLYLQTENYKDGHPVVYSSDDAPLPVATLPFFGDYTLQLIRFPSHQVSLGIYDDGQLTIVSEQISKIQKILDQDVQATTSNEPGLALLMTAKGYQPVGWYSADEKRMTLLTDLLNLNTTIEKTAEFVPSEETVHEQFFVLQNEYQQLVFSNKGGALAEINLPFVSEQNKKSVVHPVAFDRDIEENHPYNGYFPAHSYRTADGITHNKGTLGGYYPLLRRDLIETGSRKSIKVSPQFYGLSVISDKFPEVAELTYEVKEFTDSKIVFVATQPHRRITKTFSLNKEVKAPYVINLTIDVEGDTRNLWLSSGVPEVEMISNSPASTIKIRDTKNNKSYVEELKLEAMINTGKRPDWIANGNGFFGLIQDPLTTIGEGYWTLPVSGSEVPSRLLEIDEDYARFPADKMPGYLTMLPFPKNGSKMKFRIFAGPFSTPVLKQVDQTYTGLDGSANPDYIATQTFHGWFAFISEPFAKFLLILMTFFHFLTNSWGFSIILLTLALKVMLYPLNAWSNHSMLKMKEIAPLTQKLQEKYKNDQKKLSLEMMKLYQEKKINPLSGCFPLLIQMPFLIGMFGLLKSTFELRGAPFIPGWIDDLAAPDVVLTWKMPIFFIGNALHLLPFIVGGSIMLQQHFMSSLPKNPADWTDQQRQQKAMGNVMGIMMVALFYHMPSGLNIYFLFNNIFGVIQQWFTSYRMEPTPATVPLKVKTGKRG